MEATISRRLRNVRRIDVVLIFLGLVALEALLGSVGDDGLLGISPGEELEAPTPGRGILLGVLDHDRNALEGAFDVGAVRDREIMQVGYEDRPIGIGATLFERSLARRIDVDVVHAAERLEQ